MSDHRSIYNSNYTHEVPLVIETDLHFPGQTKLLISFDGVTFLWINGDVDHFPLIVIPLASQLDSVRRLNDGYDVLARDRIGLVNRFLTALVCRYHTPARIHRSCYRAIVDKGRGETLALIKRAGLPFEGDVNEIDSRSPDSDPVQSAYPLYSSTGALQHPGWWESRLRPPTGRGNLSKGDTHSVQFALGLYREGVNSTSVFYSFLCFYKIIELGIGNNTDQQKRWINKNVKEAFEEWPWAKVPRRRVKTPPDWGVHLYHLCRNAIAHSQLHSKKSKPRNPDDPADEMEIFSRLEPMKALAIKMIHSGKLS